MLSRAQTPSEVCLTITTVRHAELVSASFEKSFRNKFGLMMVVELVETTFYQKIGGKSAVFFPLSRFSEKVVEIKDYILLYTPKKLI